MPPFDLSEADRLLTTPRASTSVTRGLSILEIVVAQFAAQLLGHPLFELVLKHGGLKGHLGVGE